MIFIALRHVPESSDKNQTGSIDWLGALLATLGLGGLTYGLIESSRLSFFEPSVAIAIVGAILALVGFAFLEGRVKSPMLPLKLFRSRNFTGANLLTLLLYFSLSGFFFFLTLNFIQVQGFSATAAGAALLPFILIMFSLSRWSGGLIERFGPRLAVIDRTSSCGRGIRLIRSTGYRRPVIGPAFFLASSCWAWAWRSA